MINNIEEYANYVGSTVGSLKRDIYKYTACGAWVDWDDKKVTIGSIVEGTDVEFSKTFFFPFDSKEIDTWFDELEELTDEVWYEVNNDEGDKNE